MGSPESSELAQMSHSDTNQEPSLGRMDNIPASPLVNAGAAKQPLPCATPPSTAITESVLGDFNFQTQSRPIPASEDPNHRGHRFPDTSTLSHLGERGIENSSALINDPASHLSPQFNSCSDRVKVVWGTNIIISDAISSFRSFVLGFMPTERPENSSFVPSEAVPFYVQVLRRAYECEDSVIEMNGEHLRLFPATTLFYKQLLQYPTEAIQIMDTVLNEVFDELFPEHKDYFDSIQVRPFNCGKTVNLRELNPSDLDKLIRVKGIVVRVSNIIPDMRMALFICDACGNIVTVENVRGHINEPSMCSREGCGARHAMRIIHNRCLFGDRQIIKFQETPDAIPEGQTPHCITICVYDGLVDQVRPGDRLEVTGIFRSSPIRTSSNLRKSKSIFRTFVDAIHVKKMEFPDSSKGTLEYNNPSMSILSSRAQDMATLSRHPNLFQMLANSLAPTICGLEDVKKGLLLQLFGGVAKANVGLGANSLRGDINILLAGDPGVSKSQLLKSVHRLAPRGIYTSGKGSSAVGLTAYITRDSESNQLVLESGALVLSDGGICCIDEFDKMSDETRSVLHEVMEQQTVSVAKAGIITTLNARTSILASANPVDSKYNQNKSIVENLNLPPTILSRFDLIFLILDNINVEQDQLLGRHIVSLFTRSQRAESNTDANFLNGDLLLSYISYAKTLSPEISDEAAKELATSYVKMRKINGSAGKTVSATTRQLESLIRLSEAHARMRLSPIVEKNDVEEVSRLMREAMHSYALDPLTGKIDMDLITTGKSTAARERQDELKKAITNWIISNNIQTIELETLLAAMRSQSSIFIELKWMHSALEELSEEGFLTISGSWKRGSSLIRKN